MEGGGKEKSPKKIQEKTVVTHTHTPKDINPLPKNPTVTLRIHTHTTQWNVTWTHQTENTTR
jgi:hypothetical protein